MTKKPRTFALRYIPCGCHVREGCDRCNHTGYRTKHVPLADAIAEVEEQNAEAFLESVKQTQEKDDRPCSRCRFGLAPGDAGECLTCKCVSTYHPDSPTVGKEHPMSCDVCGHVRDHPTSVPLASAYIRCSACDRLTYHSPGGTPALLTPHSARPSGTQVGDQPCSDPNREAKGDAGPKNEGCPKCGRFYFQTVRPLWSEAAFKPDGTLAVPSSYDGFACISCGAEYPVLPIPTK